MRTFYHLLANTALVSIFNATAWFAITFYAYLQTESVMVTGTIGGIFLVATASSGFWLGSIVDNYKKKGAILVSTIISLAMFAAALTIYLAADHQEFTNPTSATLWVFITLILLGVIASNIRNIAIPTIVTMIVPESKRANANGLVGTIAGTSFTVTSVISGLLVGFSGMYWVLILAVIASIVATIDLAFIHIEEKGIAPVEGEAALLKKGIDIKGTLTVIAGIPGLFALIIFTTFNNFLGGVFFALLDAYGLNLVSVEAWGILLGILSTGFIAGGLIIAKWGLGSNPLRTMLLVNVILWTVASLFTIQASLILLIIGMFIYMGLVPFAESSEQTILQKVVPFQRQGRVFGFAQSIESAAAPLTAFLIGPITQFVAIPFMTTGAGTELIGSWFGTGQDRGIALVFTLTGLIGLVITIVAFRSKYYHLLSNAYLSKSNTKKS